MAGWWKAFLRLLGGAPATVEPQAGPIRPTEQDFVRVHVTADETILVGGRAVTLDELPAMLQAAVPPARAVMYSRDNPEIPSEFGSRVIECCCRLRLPIAFDVPPGHTPPQSPHDDSGR